MMSARITTKYEDKVHDGNGIIKIDFDALQKDKLYFEMEVIGVPQKTEILWEVFSNSVQLDVNDLTKGRNAEFFILKSYAGSKERPRNFTIIVKDTLGNRMAKLEIEVVATPTLTEAYWGGVTSDEKKYEVAVNDNFTVYYKGFGIYNIPLSLRFYLKSSDGNDLALHEFSKTVYIQEGFDMQSFYFDADILKNNKLFFLKNAPVIMVDYLTNKNLLSVTGQKRDFVIAKAYFTISYNSKKLFDGNEQNNLLNLIFDTTKIVYPSDPIQSVSPVVVYNEQYFTQKYEPCKYEKIFFKNGENAEQEVFNENKPTKKNVDGSFQNVKFAVSAIVPPKGSKNIKELQLRLENVKTDDCSFSDDNKSLTVLSEDSAVAHKKPHKGRVFDTKDLDEAHIEYTLEKPDEKIIIKPSFDYKYDKNEAWKFLKSYFLFSTTLSNKNLLENEIKGVLMDAEAAYKHIVDHHRIEIETCRYKKNLELHTYADVAWAFHAIFDDPYIPEYYMENKEIKTVKGLEKELDWLKDNEWVDRFTAPIIGLGLGNDFIKDFVLDIIKDMADRYEMGFTAYYDFDREGKKNSRQIDYAETHPEVFKTLIAGIVTIEILIDVLLIILTEGAALANFISKTGKVAGLVNKGGKIVQVGKKAEAISAKYSKTFEKATQANNAKNALELMKGSYFRGYRYVEDKDMGVQPVLEERVKISPLINLGISEEKSLGELLVDATGFGMIVNIGASASGGFGTGVSKIFTDKIEYTNQEGNKVKIGKTAGAWARAAKYPLRIVNKGLTKVYELAAFASDKALEKVFGAKAEFEKDITAHYDMDFWLRVHNGSKKLDLVSLAKGHSKGDHSSLSIAPSGAFTVRLKLSGRVSDNVVVRAMNVLTWNNKESGIKDMKAEGEFEVEGNVFYELRFILSANDEPHFEQKLMFTGLAGEYQYKIENNDQEKDRILKKTVVKKEPTHFIFMEPCEFMFHSEEMTKNPSK